MHGSQSMTVSGPSVGYPEISERPFQIASNNLTRSQVQYILDEAQIEAGRHYRTRPLLCEALQSAFRKALEDCNGCHTNYIEVLEQQLYDEWWLIDDFNQYRLSSECWKNTDDADTDSDDIPDIPESFLLRHQVSLRGLDVHAHPLMVRSTNCVIKTEDEIFDIASGTTEKISTGRGGDGYDKLGDAPSMLLEFPNGNITLAEICAFLPQSVKSWDVIDRLIWNGAMTVTLVTMINHFRNMPRGEIGNNSVYRMMQDQIKQHAHKDPDYRNWTVGNHQRIAKPPDYDAASISVAGFRAPMMKKSSRRTFAPSIPFRDLANGVKNFPSGFDALDLTRCVGYCVEHPEQEYRYPDHFEHLVSRLPHDPINTSVYTGSVTVTRKHQDSEVVKRFTSASTATIVRNSYERKRDSRGCLLRKDHIVDYEGNDNGLPSGAKSGSKGPSRKVIHKLDLKSTPIWAPSLVRPPVNNSLVKQSLKSTPPIQHVGKFSKTLAKSEFESGARGRSQRPRRVPEASESDSASDSDTYRGPRRQKKIEESDVRRSSRKKRVLISYNVDAALEAGEEDEEEELVRPHKRSKTAADVRHFGRK